tara:strand:+ start:10064 stop:10903 length:840 start_codon:yes stop_codon:yes gene_type:complete
MHGILSSGIVIALENFMLNSVSRTFRTALLLSLLPLSVAAKGDGCASSSQSDAPDVQGEWNVTYDDALDVTIRIGGEVYDQQLGSAGGVINVTHNGQLLSFDLDCARPEVVCPSEAWPASIQIEQRNVQFEHRMIATLPQQSCSGELVTPSADDCGEGSYNPDCALVCDGAVTVDERETFGVIGESGESFRLYLGAGIATNGVNCALLGISLADATLENEGDPASEEWRSIGMSAGLVTVGYAGACLWAGDPDMDQELEALVLGASVEFRTGFTGERAN